MTYLIWCMTRYFMRWTYVPQKVTRCAKLRSAQCSPELALRSRDFHAQENYIFPALKWDVYSFMLPCSIYPLTQSALVAYTSLYWRDSPDATLHVCIVSFLSQIIHNFFSRLFFLWFFLFQFLSDSSDSTINWIGVSISKDILNYSSSD